jgi:hypothetical protein
MDWITGIITVASMELIARRRWEGWAVGLVNQVFWVWLSIERGLYGLLVLTAVLTVQYIRGLLRWRRTPAPPLHVGPRKITLELDRLDYDAVQTAICLMSVLPGFPPPGTSNAAGTALAEVCRGWQELRSLSTEGEE